jgi:pterin-4a-carbinolamine dehydratase
MHITIDYSTGTITLSKNGVTLATHNTTDLTEVDFSMYHDRP